MDKKELLHKCLQHFKVLHIPAFTSEKEETPLCFVKGTLQKSTAIMLDSIQRVDKEGSIVDFIARKKGSELFIGLNNGSVQLSENDRKRLETAGKSYITINVSKLDKDNMETALRTGSIHHDFHKFDAKLVTTEWIYHKKHGWQL